MPSTKTLNQSPTISAVENADLLWVWDSSASELNKISRTDLLTTTDDFNTSYARLAGRSGGQTLIGGTAANDDLTLEGTSNATRTTSYVVLQPNGGNVGIGSVLPSGTKFRISDGTASETIISIFEGTTAKTWNGTNIIESIRLRSTFTGEASSLDTARITWGYSTDLPAGGSRFGIDTINASGNYANVITITGTGNVGIGTTSPSRKLHVAGTILIDGDEGGIANTIGLTDGFDLAARSTGVGTIKFNDATNRDSSGFVKIYIGVTEYYIPVFAAI